MEDTLAHGASISRRRFQQAEMDRERVALLRRWTNEQTSVAQKACFEDSEANSFSVASSLATSSHLLRPEAHDFDEPKAAYLDSASIRIEGLRRIAGVDISFRNDGVKNTEGNETAEDAIAVLVILDYPSHAVVASFSEQIRLTQPYIPEYLSMRELDPLTALYHRAISPLAPQERPQALFVDGNGRMHERQAGLATALGLALDVPTVGAGKEYHPLRPDIAEFSKLSPQPVPAPPWPPILHFRSSQRDFRHVVRKSLRRRGDWLGLPFGRGGELVGAALASSPLTPRRTQQQRPPLQTASAEPTQAPASERQSGDTPDAEASPVGKPVFVSSGHRLSLASSIALVLACCTENRVPEPVRIADRMGREEARRVWPPVKPG